MNERDKSEQALIVLLVAKYGSIIKVCSQSPGSRLFRLMDPWIERGLVFAWCVPLKESEIQQVVGTPVSSQFSREEDSQDIIEDFSQPSSLPPYEPEQGEERLLMAFSFCFINTTVSKDTFVQKEKCVGIWPPWTEMEGEDEKVYLVTRFKSDVIY